MKKIILSALFVGATLSSFAANHKKVHPLLKSKVVKECCTATIANPKTGESITATACSLTFAGACHKAQSMINKAIQ
jgi:hypothetical protein